MSDSVRRTSRSGSAPGVPRVLVVEDDDSLRGAMTRLLEVAGFDPFPYPSAEDFLQGEVPDAACVICDLRLPKMSGLGLLDELRSRGACPPFILITAHDGPGLREEAERQGAAACLPKPFLGTELLRTVRAVIASANEA